MLSFATVYTSTVDNLLNTKDYTIDINSPYLLRLPAKMLTKQHDRSQPRFACPDNETNSRKNKYEFFFSIPKTLTRKQNKMLKFSKIKTVFIRLEN